jgi:predicted component of type VI protein secretion system
MLAVMNQNIGYFGAVSSSHRDTKPASPEQRLTDNLANRMLACRVMHYLRAMVRDNLGSHPAADQVRAELEAWLQSRIVDPNRATPMTLSRQPWVDYRLEVRESASAHLHLELKLAPHPQLVDIEMTLAISADLS